MDTANLLKEIRSRTNLSQVELAQVLGTSLVSVTRWEENTSTPSPDLRNRIMELHRKVQENPNAHLLLRSKDSVFASRGVRSSHKPFQNTLMMPLFEELRPPSVTVVESPGRSVLTRVKQGNYFDRKGKARLLEILAAHTSPAIVAVKPPPAGMSAGKNTYTYDAHTYHTKVPPQGIAELLRHYLPQGGLVFDPFAGSGMTGVASNAVGYDCILNELSPAACFIADRFTSQIAPDLFAAGVKAVLEALQELRDALYTTSCRECGRPVEFLYVVWSYRVICNKCEHEFLLWDHCRKYGKTVREHKILSEFPCPNCRKTIRKSYLERTVAEPAMVVYKCCRPEYARHPASDEDIERIQRIEAEFAPVAEFYPTTALPDGVNLRQPKKHGLDSINKFYTVRNLVAMSHLWQTIHRVESDELAAYLAFAFTSLYQRVTRLSEFRFWGGSGNMARFNVPFVFKEANVFDTYSRKARSIQDHLEATAARYKGSSLVVNQSATALDYLPDESIDLIFTDPPFGANINYSEMNILWESWLGEFTDPTQEAIINKTQRKGVRQYQSLMTQSLEECYRVLRPGHWMLLVFMNSSQTIWRALREAITDAGFAIRKVDIFDKQHGTFKQFVSDNTAGADLVLHCIKPVKPTDRSYRPKAADSRESINAFLAEIDLDTYRQAYLHVNRDEELDYRMLYSEWLSEVIIYDIPVIDFAKFRSVVKQWIRVQGDSFKP